MGMAGFASVVVDEGVVLRSADVNGFTVSELRFPAGYVQEPFEPDLPYLAVVIGGALEKSFGGGMALRPGAALTMPAGATHGARFGNGASVVIVKARGRASDDFDRLRPVRGLGLLARRLSSELRASDAAAPLAAEGIALELLAATARSAGPGRRRGWGTRRSSCAHGTATACASARSRVSSASRRSDRACVPRTPRRVRRRVRPPGADRVGSRAGRRRRPAARGDRGRGQVRGPESLHAAVPALPRDDAGPVPAFQSR